MKNTRRLLEIMARLRHPEHGCPWDRQQNFESLIPYTIEEAYEVADAVERNDFDALRDELGDLLLQVAFHARLAEERALFDFEAVAAAICEKLERRHPHVFADVRYASEAERKRAWELAKQAERRQKQPAAEPASVLDGIAQALPALIAADKIQSRAAAHGFDWKEVAPVFDKVDEELAEVKEALASGDQVHVEEEVGDLLFVVVNLARHLNVDAETALQASNRKFKRRFQHIEQQLAAQGRSLTACELAELDALWEEAKARLRKSGP